MSKEGVIINKIIDLYIKNNEEELNYLNIESKFDNDIYKFDIENDSYIIELKDNLVFHKKSIESDIHFIFDIQKETTGTYYIKELDFYMDAKVKTIRLEKNNNNIEIEYKLWLQDEEIGNFIFKLRVKE